MSDFVITIARGFGSGGRTVGKLLSGRLAVDYYDSDLIKLASEESGINIALFGRADERVKAGLFKRYNRSYGEYLLPPDSEEFVSDDNLFNYQAKIIKDLAEKENCIIIGRCADYILRSYSNVVRVFVYADRKTCIKNVVELYGIKPEDAESRIENIDRQRAAYYKYYTGREWTDPRNYDLCINTSKLDFEACADVIQDFLKTKKLI